MKAVIGLLLLCASYPLRAQMISEALLVFPAQTQSLEYDNLASLRTLPNYSALQQRFSGAVLEQAKLAISKLGIAEGQVDEIALGSTPTAVYGLLGGTFNGAAGTKIALRKRIPSLKVNGEQIFCPAAGMCLLFLENSIAAFGTTEQLKSMTEARVGGIARLGSNRDLSALLYATDRSAPVRGAGLGSRLNALLGDALEGATGKHSDWLRYSSGISAFAYSMHLDGKAHITATLECKTAMEATILRQTLGALAGLQSLAIQAGKEADAMPFQNMVVSSSDRRVEVKMDAPIPGS